MCELEKLIFLTAFQSLFNCFLISCVTSHVTINSFLFLIPFPFLYLFFPFIPLSFLSTVFLYNLYLNPNLLKILSNYTYTIPKVTTLHTYILTSCPIFLYTFSVFLLFLHAFLSYFLTFPTHCLTVPKLILLYLVISYYPFNCKHMECHLGQISSNKYK